MFHWWNFLCLLNAGSICRFSALRQVQTASQQIDAALQEAQTTKLPKILQQVEEQRDTCSRSTAWAARFRPRRSARCCRKRSGRQIGDHLKKPFADFGISCLLSGLGALLGIAQVLGGFRTHRVACVDVHSGTSHMYGRCLTLTHSMPWFGHSVQNRHAARDV
jgi:hypothetical protein